MGKLCYAQALRKKYLIDIGGHEFEVVSVETEEISPMTATQDRRARTYISAKSTEYEDDRVNLDVPASFTFDTRLKGSK